MFEELTYENILNRALLRVSDNLDKRQGSVIYDAIAPACAELAQAYIWLDEILNEGFADTASREYLVKRASERGLSPYSATNAILRGKFDIAVNIGERFNLEELNYMVTEYIGLGDDGYYYKLKCESEGVCGNKYFGAMTPIENINGLGIAQVTEVLIPGEDEEDTEVFRQRYFDSLNTVAFGGNIADYKTKTNAIAGVGATKVIPVWNGGGTVKLIIQASDFGVATTVLINNVQGAIDPTDKSGEGFGLAPIGHVVTVEPVSETEVNILTSITFENGYSWNNLQDDIDTVVEAYMLELRKQWADKTSLIVRVSQIESRLLDIAGIVDIAETKINEIVGNLTLDTNKIPVLGSVSSNE